MASEFVGRCGHDVVSPCPAGPRALPHPARRAKEFACSTALADLPATSVSDRLLSCARGSIRDDKSRALLVATADSRA